MIFVKESKFGLRIEYDLKKLTVQKKRNKTSTKLYKMAEFCG